MGNLCSDLKKKKNDYVNVECSTTPRNTSILVDYIECPICLNVENTILLSCNKHDHYAHIECILQSNKLECPTCFNDVYYDCVEHIKKCKNKTCICKNKSKIYETEKKIAHKLISDFTIMSSSYSSNNILIEIKKMLIANNLKNVDEIMGIYS